MTSPSDPHDDRMIDLLDGEEIPLPPAPRPCEDLLVEADPIDWRRDRTEDRLREWDNWDEAMR